MRRLVLLASSITALIAAPQLALAQEPEPVPGPGPVLLDPGLSIAIESQRFVLRAAPFVELYGPDGPAELVITDAAQREVHREQTETSRGGNWIEMPATVTYGRHRFCLSTLATERYAAGQTCETFNFRPDPAELMRYSRVKGQRAIRLHADAPLRGRRVTIEFHTSLCINRVYCPIRKTVSKRSVKLRATTRLKVPAMPPNSSGAYFTLRSKAFTSGGVRFPAFEHREFIAHLPTKKT